MRSKSKPNWQNIIGVFGTAIILFVFYWFVWELLLDNLRYSHHYSYAMLEHRLYLKMPHHLREQFSYVTAVEYSYAEKFLDMSGVDMSYTIFMKKCAAGELLAQNFYPDPKPSKP